MTLFANHATMNINTHRGLHPKKCPVTMLTTPKRPHLVAGLPPTAGVQQHFHTAEQVLYTQLTTTSMGVLNDVRHAFMIVAKGAGRPAWVRGELAGVAAASVDTRCTEQQEQLQQLFTASTQ
ncbi:hypothetical protein B0H14DRAFT_3473440 [Mycena olivaceomarginata]|nr:hypothetical protein B0H14DRAFT_3473440 [Mycena olivaceomarginata]